MEHVKTKVDPDHDKEELDEEDPIYDDFGGCHDKEVVGDGAETLIIWEKLICTEERKKEKVCGSLWCIDLDMDMNTDTGIRDTSLHFW